MMERQAFLMKAKHQCHLSQQGEWVCLTQSWKERRLQYKFVFVPIDEWTLTLKNDGKISFSYETKQHCHLSQWGEWVYGAQ